MKRWVVFTFFFAVQCGAVFCLNCPAQTPTPSPSPTSPFIKNVIHDQKAIWSSPFRMKKQDVRKIVPFALLTAGLIASDRHTSAWVGRNGSLPAVSKTISRFGNTWVLAGGSAGLYFLGKATKNHETVKTGRLAIEALVGATLVTQAIKFASGRLRPDLDSGRGLFFHNGRSFPSGHASGAWAVATILAYRYKRNPLIRFGVIAFAAAISLSRYTGRKHFLSDVLVGSALGYGIGRYVYQNR